MPGAKHWCFTLNNYTVDDEEALKELGEGDSVQYLVYGRETAPDTGTPHLQGYVVFESRKTLRQVRGLVRNAHLEKAKGKPSQAADYSKKDGDFVEFGMCPGGQGSRTDIHEAWKAATEGATSKDLARDHGEAYIKFYRGLERVRQLMSEPRTWKTDVTVYFGATGTGKTKTAFESRPEAYVHPGGSWFDGYDRHDFVIFDDFGGSEFKITYLLKLLDRYPMRVPVKGSFVEWVPREVYITSNYAPEDWYPNAKDEHVAALLRRIETIIQFTNIGKVTIKPVD